MRRRRKIAVAVLGLGLTALALTGCRETLDERIQNRATCEGAGGVYVEHVSGWDYKYSGWDCDLSTKK